MEYTILRKMGLIFGACVALIAMGTPAARGSLNTNTWTGGAGSWTNASQWSSGVVPNNGVSTQYVVFIDGGKVAASSVWIDQLFTFAVDRVVVDNGDSLTLSNGATLWITNGLTCNGTVTLTGNLNGTYLAFSGAQTMGGTGQVVLAGADPNSDAIYTTNGTLTLGPGLAIHCLGGGISGDPSHTLVNQGTVSSEGNGQTLAVRNFLNQGYLLATNGAVLQIFFPTNSGTVTLHSFSTLQSTGDYVQTTGSTILNGGNLTPQNGASVRIQGGSVIGNGYVNGNVTNSGTISPGFLTGLLSFPGNLILTTGSVLAFNLGGYAQVTQYDLLSVSNTARFGGLLTVQFINNYSFISSVTNGSVFTLVTAGAPIAGAFTNVASGSRLRSSDGFADFLTTYSASNLILSDLRILDDDADGIPNWWTQEYFGHLTGQAFDKSRAQDDADGTGQSNLLKYTAGLNPFSSSSIFGLTVQNVPAQPNQKNLVFGPIAPGRTYTPQFTTNLVGAVWSAISPAGAPQTNGTQVTVTDLNATQIRKFYRVQVTLP